MATVWYTGYPCQCQAIGSFLFAPREGVDVLAAELHCHSEHSHDGEDPVGEMLANAVEAGLDVIAITDHDTLAGSHEAMELAPSYDIIALPAIEVSTVAGHVLAIGVSESIPSKESFDQTIERIHDAGGVAIVAHPYQRLRRGVLANLDPDALAIADAIETYNSRFLTGRTNRQAATLATRLGLPATAGSDAHIAEMVGRSQTLIDAEPDPEAIVTAIRDGKTSIDGQRTPITHTLRKAAGTAHRRMRRRMP